MQKGGMQKVVSCRKGFSSYYWCAREAGVNAGESPAGAIRRFSTEDRANCVAGYSRWGQLLVLGAPAKRASTRVKVPPV
jgi:hypothetical protein